MFLLVHPNGSKYWRFLFRFGGKQHLMAFGGRAMACHSLIESGLWSKDAVEHQMSHMERNTVRAAYIHKAEFIDKRKLMLQWWADFLDANWEKGITPFNYVKINRGNSL
ncbi:phage integrase family protein [Raoultella ornithinolytica B6]|nr:phage integrase family protein [Raoultella ornithinolytica B6]